MKTIAVIASNGGTGRDGHISAGDEDELSEAFQVIVNDVKVCDDP